MRIASVSCLWDKAQHNAFTDLVRFNGQLICCFREASTHISPDGNICLVYFDAKRQIKEHLRIRLPDCDLRDPKLSVTPDGKLLLLAYAKFFEGSADGRHTSAAIWTSSDGNSFSQHRTIAERQWWLWRVRWHKNSQVCGNNVAQKAYGFAYNRSQERIKLYAGDPRRAFHLVQDEALSKRKHNLGYPNESDMLFRDNTAFALVRRDADRCSAQLGVATYPFVNWRWHDLKVYIGGPVMTWLDDESIIIAGRIWYQRQFKTALLTLNLKTKNLRLACILPSAGDNSYPGLVKDNEQLLVSYYSSHQYQKSNIYLAEVQLESVS
ncbi:MAG: hypothetical protein ACFHVJ_20875 [Aestuariibacter sp.]